MADRAVAPSNQWPVKGGKGAGGVFAIRRGQMFPMLEDGVWGWTDIPAEADGIVVLEDEALGVDDYDTAGGLRTFGLNGVGPLFAIED